MKNSFLKHLLIILLLMLALCGCSDIKNTNSYETNNSNISTDSIEARTAIVFKIVEGNGIKLLRSNETYEIYEGLRLLSGDSIITDDVSTVYLRIDDDKNILLGKNTKLIVNELKSDKIALKLEYGEFFFNVENKLSNDEEMEFSIGSTSMLIRGTSGAGKLNNDNIAAFSVYTGKTEIVDSFYENINYTLLPNIILNFDVNSGSASQYQNSSLAVISPDDIPNVVQDYISLNDNYKNELESNGWEIDSENGLIPDRNAIIEIIKNSKIYDEIVLNIDGISDNNKTVNVRKNEEKIKTEITNEIHSSYDSYTYIDMPIIVEDSLTFTYDGLEHQIVSGFNSNTMILTGDIYATNDGTYSFSIVPKSSYKWKDGTRIPVSSNWIIKAIEIDKPTLLSSNMQFTYNGNNQSIINVNDIDITKTTLTGDVTKKDSGSYSFKLTPKDHYIWSDTENNEDYTVDWVIKPITLKIETYNTGYQKEYDGNKVSYCSSGITTNPSILNCDESLIAVKQKLTTSSADADINSYNAINEFELFGDTTIKNNYILDCSSCSTTIPVLINKKNITISITAPEEDRIYNGKPVEVSKMTAVVDGVLSNDEVKVTLNNTGRKYGGNEIVNFDSNCLVFNKGKSTNYTYDINNDVHIDKILKKQIDISLNFTLSSYSIGNDIRYNAIFISLTPDSSNVIEGDSDCFKFKVRKGSETSDFISKDDYYPENYLLIGNGEFVANTTTSDSPTKFYIVPSCLKGGVESYEMNCKYTVGNETISKISNIRIDAFYDSQNNNKLTYKLFLDNELRHIDAFN